MHSGYALEELLEAEDAGLIGAQWRNSVDVDGTLKHLSTLTDEFVAKWRAEFARFRIEFGEDDYDDQSMDDIAIIFSMRDELELGRRFVPEDVYAQIYLVDDEFRDFVVLVLDRIPQARHNWRHNICLNLPNFWWWRADLEGIPDPWKIQSRNRQ